MAKSKNSTPGQNSSTRSKKSYYEGIGRRKTATARVRILVKKSKGESEFEINGKTMSQYFPSERLQKTVEEPVKKIKIDGHFAVSSQVSGGGTTGQAEAIRMGLARALEKYNPELHSELKSHNFLTRDDRMKERKKPGLKGARRGQQWSKR